MFRYLAAIAVGAAVLASPVRDALACQCSSDGPAYSVEAAREWSSFIFEARVETQRPRAGGAPWLQLELVDVKAHRGAAPGTALTLTNGDVCGQKQLAKGQRYLFYLRDASSVHINACSRVIAFPDAQEEVAALGGARTSPSEGPQAPPDVPAAPTTAAPTRSGVPSVPPQSGGCSACHAAPTESKPTSQGSWLLALAAALAVRHSARRRGRSAQCRCSPRRLDGGAER
jgi:hypothetical protein